MEKEKLERVSVDEKISLLRGNGIWNTNKAESIGFDGFAMSDGPIGIRKEIQNKGNGMGVSSESTCYPSGALLACSFDPEVFAELGRCLAKDAIGKDVQVVLGPAMNIKRNPLCGRGFEYLSEDPYLTYKMASSYVKSIQEKGVGACIKHYAVNSSETDRMVVDEVVDERALRELYLRPFEKTIKESNPSMVMASYNKINGQHGTENRYLLTELLRNEWNYKGVVVSDWYAVNDPVLSIYNGLNLEMPEDMGVSFDLEKEEYEKSEDFRAKVDESISYIYDLYESYPRIEPKTPDLDKQHECARKLASESIVLLRNEDKILPFKKEEKIGVIGPFATEPRYQGGGSSHIESHKVDSFLSVLLSNGIKCEYDKGYELSKSNRRFSRKALDIAKECEKVIFFAGIDERLESEGFDRDSLDLPKNQLLLIDEITKINKNVIVVLMNGGPVKMPFVNKVKGIVETYLGGEAVSEALYDIVFGDVNPSGHLTETFPLSIKDVPSYDSFPGNRYYSLYKESIFVGYRYYSTKNVDVLYPFGYGLSYSDFEYSDFRYDVEKKEVSFRVKNISSIKGKAVPQIYISKPNDVVFNSAIELCAFDKIELEPGEYKDIVLKIDNDAFEYYDVKSKKFTELYGKYAISLRTDCNTIIDSHEFVINGKNDSVNNQEQLSCYYDNSIREFNEKSFFTLYGKEYRKPSKEDPISFDTSLIQAKERGSKGARLLLSLMTSVRGVRVNKMVLASIQEVPIRMYFYMVPGLYEKRDRFLDLLNDKHINSNTIFILKMMLKMKDML